MQRSLTSSLDYSDKLQLKSKVSRLAYFLNEDRHDIKLRSAFVLHSVQLTVHYGWPFSSC